MAAGTVGVLLELTGVHSVVVSVLVLVFIVVAPTAAIAGLLRGFDVLARIILAAVTAVAIVTLIAMIMLAAGIWSTPGGLVAIAIISAACWLAQDGRAARFRFFPGVNRLQGKPMSRRITGVSGRLVALMAGLATGRRRPAAENRDAPDADGATEQQDPECASPAAPATSGPGDSAPDTQPPRLGSPPVTRPAPQPDSEATQI